MGLLKSLDFYESAPYSTELGKEATPLKTLGLEFFSMLRTGMNVKCEFADSEELKRIRDAYILHLLDYVM